MLHGHDMLKAKAQNKMFEPDNQVKRSIIHMLILFVLSRGTLKAGTCNDSNLILGIQVYLTFAI